MKVILDTNVFISAFYFDGYPHRILKECNEGRISLVISEENLERGF